MNRRIVRWGTRSAIAAAALLLVGFGVGTVASRRPATHTTSLSPAFAPAARSAPGSVSNGVAAAPPLGVTAGSADLSSAPSDTAFLPALPERVVKTAELTVRLRAGRFDAAWSSVATTATRLGGYVASSGRATQPQPVPVPVPETGNAADAKAQPASGDVTIRVPAKSFEAALVQLRALGTVTGDQVSTNDVTQQYVDLQGRLRNQRAQQAALLQLMGRAKTVSDTLAVQSQLSNVEDQIEQITGRLNLLANQTALSTITVHLFEPNAPGAPASPAGPSLSKAWHTSIQGLERMGTVAMIGVLWLLPFAAIAMAAAWLMRLRRRPAAGQA